MLPRRVRHLLGHMIEREPTIEGFPPLVLSEQQQLLYDELLKREGTSTEGTHSLAVLYLGTIRVLQDDKNPSRLQQAAYSMRELLNKLEENLGIYREGAAVVSERIHLVKPSWNKALRLSGSLSAKTWSGEIDAPLSRFLDEIGGFFYWYENRVTGPIASSQVVQKLQRSEAYYPKSWHEDTQDRFSKAHGFFNGILHHNISVEHGEFESRLRDMELFLLELFLPKTTEYLDSLDELIREGEQDAHHR